MDDAHVPLEASVQRHTPNPHVWLVRSILRDSGDEDRLQDFIERDHGQRARTLFELLVSLLEFCRANSAGESIEADFSSKCFRAAWKSAFWDKANSAPLGRVIPTIEKLPKARHGEIYSGLLAIFDDECPDRAIFGRFPASLPGYPDTESSTQADGLEADATYISEETFIDRHEAGRRLRAKFSGMSRTTAANRITRWLRENDLDEHRVPEGEFSAWLAAQKPVRTRRNYDDLD